MKCFKLTEEQYKRAVKEGLLSEQPTTSLTVDGEGNSNVGQAVQDAVNKSQGTSTKEIKVTNFGNGPADSSTNSTSVFESRIITKKDIIEARLKKLREHSEIVLAKDLFGI